MRPICSAVGTSTFQLSKYDANIIKPAARSRNNNIQGTDLNDIDNFEFLKQIQEIDISEYHMVSYDVCSLFTIVVTKTTA